MSWKCKNCGTSNSDGAKKCKICEVWPRRPLRMKAESGGELTLNMSTVCDQAWALMNIGEDGKYWDKNRQFDLERRSDGWYIVPNVEAVNDTLVDEVRIDSAQRLGPGALVAVGRESKGIKKSPLKVLE